MVRPTQLNRQPEVAEYVRASAHGLGFDLVGIAKLGEPDSFPAFIEWLERDLHADMHYLERGRVRRSDTRLPAPGMRSAVVVGLNYGGTSRTGPIARYARGPDYHDVMLHKLNDLLEQLQTALPGVQGKAYVDTGPILERDLARRAGIGWFGRNSNLINPKLGSFFFIGVLLLDADLEPDEPFTAEHCGTCTRCVDACPTHALIDDKVLDANLCISYLTIENRGGIPLELRPLVGELLYGCDICQDVCPWNERFSRALTEPDLAAYPWIADLASRDLLEMSEDAYRERFRGSPMTRARRRGLARNAAVTMGNARLPEDLDALVHALHEHDDPLVRAHCAWALGRFGSVVAHDALRMALEREADASVRREIAMALNQDEASAPEPRPRRR